ncbi:FecR family protein [Hyphococcus luteus]|nr:FecR domain-containing protein [Marinicaulis flavus]
MGADRTDRKEPRLARPRLKHGPGADSFTAGEDARSEAGAGAEQDAECAADAGADDDAASRAETEAAEWLMAIASGEAGPTERAAFKAWRGAAPANARAYEEAERLKAGLAASPEMASLAERTAREIAADARRRSWISSALSSLGSLKHAFARPVLSGSASSRPAPSRPAFDRPRLSRPAMAAALASILLFATIAAVIQWRALGGAGVDYESETGAARRIALKDGSVIDLAPESRLRVAFTADARQAALLDGEAFFEIAKDESRPFIVRAGKTQVRVTGTRFNVHRGPDRVTIAVEEGHVAVARAPRRFPLPALPSLQGPSSNDKIDGASEQKLAAGEVAVADADGVSAPAPTGAGRPGVWRDGLLVYRDASLEAVVADLNRYSQTEIVIASRALGEARIMAAFQTDNIGEMLDGLEDLLGVTVDRADPNRIVIREREGA